MKDFTALWFITSMFVMPCVLNLENLWCLLIVMSNIIASFLAFRKHNPEYIN
jgi:3-hydroxymyristoyl/3-hydroxydecanoyl-(acyl carrier protein) dehydratase